MDGFGTMREKLDIKLLILFILRRLPGAVDAETLANLALADGTLGYFEYAECLAELVDSEHIEQSLQGYRITDKGDRNCEIVESSLPYTQRSRLEKKLKPLAETMRRRAMITAEHEQGEDGCRVHLAMSDGVSTVMDMRLLCGSEEQASKIEETFRRGAEKCYTEIMELLLS